MASRSLAVAAEGEEELGSPHYPQIIDAYEDRLKSADGVLFPFNSQTPDGRINMILGVKGIVYFEMIATGGKWGGPSRAEIHGSYKAIVDSPVWRLIKALSSLTSEDGNTILVPGYYDDIRPPTSEESWARRRARTVPALVFVMVDSTRPRSTTNTVTGTGSGRRMVRRRTKMIATRMARITRMRIAARRLLPCSATNAISHCPAGRCAH